MKPTTKKIILSLYHYFCFFLLMAFLISCCMLLFLNTMTSSMNIVLTEDDINTAAILTFGNVLLLSGICTAIDCIRRKYTVNRHVKKIVEAAEEISKGNYSVRVPQIKSINHAEGLDKISDCFNKMAHELESVETMRSDFVSGVSHELKTPLAVMQNYGTLLAAKDVTEEQRHKYAKEITNACSKLSDLVTNILKLNKLENSEIYPSVTEYDLTEQLCQCLLGFEHIWEEKNIEISTELEENVMVNGDPELLSVVWNNLLSNAFKFTNSGGSVALGLKTEGNRALVYVKDTGIGIDNQTGKHIFEKFYQGDSSHSTGGNGLGLALVMRVINIVGGEIEVSSKVGEGSVFTVKLYKNGKA